jgi:hypothetical protein
MAIGPLLMFAVMIVAPSIGAGWQFAAFLALLLAIKLQIEADRK